MLGDMGDMAGVSGDVVVEELAAGEIGSGSGSSVATACDTVTSVVLMGPAAAWFGWLVAAARFSIAELRRIIILLVLGRSRLLLPTNSLLLPWLCRK